MRYLILILLAVIPLCADVGDNAPGIPATYVNAHPRLPAPSNADLNNIFNNVASGSARYKTDADAWSANATNGSGFAPVNSFRHLIVWYKACKLNSAACAAAYGSGYQAGLLAKIVRVAHLNGLWGPLTYTAADGVVAGTNCGGSTDCSLTSNASNFLTVCGGTCVGLQIGVNGRTYIGGAVTTVAGGTNNKIALTTIPSGIAPVNGSALDFGITTSNGGALNGQWAYCMIFDWINGDLDATTQQLLITAIEGWLTIGELNYTQTERPSPFNDHFYIDIPLNGIMLAVTIYPDDANSIGHLRFWMDAILNVWLPVFKLFGGQNAIAENDAGTASNLAPGIGMNATQAAAQPGYGLYWPEGWDGYQINQISLTKLMGPAFLSWATASGQMTGTPPKFFADNGFLKNWSYGMMYKTRPDYVVEHMNGETRGYLLTEYDSNATANSGYLLGTQSILAAVYNDPTLRGWERCMNLKCAVPDGFEASGWPWYTPDSAANLATGSPTAATNCGGKPGGPRCNLGLVRDFPAGRVFMRTGWSEDDTECGISYMQSYWSKGADDTGAFHCFHRGQLAVTSGGVYRASSGSPHYKGFVQTGMAFNKPLFYDPADYYATEGVAFALSDGSTVNRPVPNTGGGRLPISEVGNGIKTCGANVAYINQYIGSPDDIAMWRRNFEFYHKAKRVAYQVGSGNKYTYVAVDFTDDYNNAYSANPFVNPCQYNTANTANRTLRVQKAVRHFLFIPDGTSAWVIVYDQLISAPGNFANIVKKNLIRTINQPVVVGNSWTALRTELVNELPFSWTNTWSHELTHCSPACGTAPNNYQYNGKMLGWMTWAGPSSGSTGSITLVGGPGHEFEITDAAGTINYNECQLNQCQAPGEGVGSITGFVNPDPNVEPNAPGSWRIEELFGGNHLEDYSVNVMRFTDNGDAETISVAPSTSFSSGNFITTFTFVKAGNSCAISASFPKYGIQPIVTATGTGCPATF